MTGVSKVRLVDAELVRETDFALFWEIYPRKKGKLDAMRAWQQTKRLRPPVEKLIAAVHSAVQSGEWNDERFIPYPATWLRDGRWDDE